jgi:hypothetical protein
MVRPLLKLAGLAMALGVLSASSSAVIWNLSTSLTGGAEVPPTGSTATGTFTATYDTVTDTLNYMLDVTGLGSGAIAAHIHGLAGPGVNAGILIPLDVVAGQTTFMTMNSVVASYSAAAPFESALQNGQINCYVNVHSSNFPGGEIRGQLNAVPEPATLFLLAPALLAFRKRRIKR